MGCRTEELRGHLLECSLVSFPSCLISTAVLQALSVCGPLFQFVPALKDHSSPRMPMESAKCNAVQLSTSPVSLATCPSPPRFEAAAGEGSVSTSLPLVHCSLSFNNPPICFSACFYFLVPSVICLCPFLCVCCSSLLVLFTSPVISYSFPAPSWKLPKLPPTPIFQFSLVLVHLFHLPISLGLL